MGTQIIHAERGPRGVVVADFGREVSIAVLWATRSWGHVRWKSDMVF